MATSESANRIISCRLLDTTPKSTKRWSPFAPTSTSLLIHGYIRRIIGYADDVSDDIVHALCLDFYDPHTHNNFLRSSSFERPIRSPIFVIAGYKWMFKCHFDQRSLVCLLSPLLLLKTNVSITDIDGHTLCGVNCTASLRGTAPQQTVTKRWQRLYGKKPHFMLRFQTSDIVAPPPLNTDIREVNVRIKMTLVDVYDKNITLFTNEYVRICRMDATELKPGQW